MPQSSLFEQFQRARWTDPPFFGMGGFNAAPTSLKGQGARTDIALLNQTAGTLARGYNLSPGINPKDHCVVNVSLALPCAAQTWYMPRTIGSV